MGLRGERDNSERGVCRSYMRKREGERERKFLKGSVSELVVSKVKS